MPELAKVNGVSHNDERPPAGDEPAAFCSRCPKTLDTTGSPPWCKSCRAKYQRDYKSIRAEMVEGRGFAAGVSAMRDHLSKSFDRLGTGSFTGSEIAALIRQSRGPVDVRD